MLFNDLSGDKKKTEIVLAAKFFTRRSLNIKAVARTFHPIWRTRSKFKVSDAGNIVLLIVFDLEVDAEKVLQGDSWAFDRHFSFTTKIVTRYNEFYKYEQASGQQLIQAKTSLFFSKNTPSEVQEEIKNKFGAQLIKQHEKYLGLPSLVGRNKRNTFNSIKEKLGKKLVGWKEKMLSKAGKEVSIKAVAQAIPTYTISDFKIPDSLCEDLTRMIQNFRDGNFKQTTTLFSTKFLKPSTFQEAKALEAGLLFAKDIGIQDFILEGDSIIVYRALCEMSTLPSSVELVIEDEFLQKISVGRLGSVGYILV
uniref:RNase H type-1 domain-containing protein n=1 Tax=Quercus lobata TaxID=97700 RepID=A0A7N2RBZ2_QUELO